MTDNVYQQQQQPAQKNKLAVRIKINATLQVNGNLCNPLCSEPKHLGLSLCCIIREVGFDTQTHTDIIIHANTVEGGRRGVGGAHSSQTQDRPENMHASQT